MLAKKELHPFPYLWGTAPLRQDEDECYHGSHAGGGSKKSMEDFTVAGSQNCICEPWRASRLSDGVSLAPSWSGRIVYFLFFGRRFTHLEHPRW